VVGVIDAPEFIESRDESWWAAIADTREAAAAIFEKYGHEDVTALIQPVKLVRVPVPDDLVAECDSWFERRPDDGNIAAWELRA
jgi:hypothetical protein